jgi:hypothetical protein
MTSLPRIAKLYETAGNTLIARLDRSDFDVFGVACDVPGGENVAYIVACTDPCRFGPSPEAWGVETLDFVIGR